MIWQCSCFNPLHCGAVVASRWHRLWALFAIEVSIPFIAGQWSLRSVSTASLLAAGVSIPFIAGQWSLLILRVAGVYRVLLFQSPSLRGSGRFRKTRSSKAYAFHWFQSPSLRGSSRFFLVANFALREYFYVSIPFIAGQWSLPSSCRGNCSSSRVSIPFIAGQWSLH